MSIKEMESKILNLEQQLIALASRPYTQRAEEAKTEATRVGNKEEADYKEVSGEIVDAAVTMADFISDLMEDYYLKKKEEGVSVDPINVFAIMKIIIKSKKKTDEYCFTKLNTFHYDIDALTNEQYEELYQLVIKLYTK